MEREVMLGKDKTLKLDHDRDVGNDTTKQNRIFSISIVYIRFSIK
ncbi:hypothetical protein Amet_0878 [Alkaliphilus metalliredigens QYMF]|uniref:Uncharacterized protein n=1 Tax=Alkaliphilus metalliredigens (strain QYMF) TaxID=293826 RepID=A6TLN2_ALKMQ|nr:hypothetical protein [Alkaliphilus metalliredigens]ABR47100.1 hypothetical protein Amet_0878 [Alkaliphilus metalliredigens QYMF]